MTRWEARTIYGSKQPSSEPGYCKSTSVPKQPAFPACGAMIPPARQAPGREGRARGEQEEEDVLLPCKSLTKGDLALQVI